jgi:hypothetical protein
MNDRPASWRMPNRQQMKKLALDREQLTAIEPAPDEPPPAEWWESVLSDPRAAGKPWLPIQQRRLSEIPRHLLRVGCLRCQRIVEIQTADAIRLYGPHAVYKDVGLRLLDDGCQHRTGRHEEDGCWPDWSG